MSYADDVRAYCQENYVGPAREAGRRQFSIRAGDVHSALGYKNRLPLVCSAIGATTFVEENGLTRISIDGPMHSSTTTFKFEFR